MGSNPGYFDLLISYSVSGLFSANQSNMASTFLMWRDKTQGLTSQEIENSAPGRRQTYDFWIKRHVLNHFATITGVSFKAIEIVNLLRIHLNSEKQHHFFVKQKISIVVWNVLFPLICPSVDPCSVDPSSIDPSSVDPSSVIR